MTALLLALLPAAADAAYAPKLTVSADPAGPSAPAKVTTTITQAAAETASRKVVVSIPTGFAAPPAINTLPVCGADQIAARACPEPSRIGAAEAVVAPLLFDITLTGSVYWGGVQPGGRFLLVVFLDNADFNQHITQRGYVSLRPDGGFDTTFDDLPTTTTKRFTLTFAGGNRAILLTPDRCGGFPFGAAFTSHSGEIAQATAPLAITGCPPVLPWLRSLHATRTAVRFRVGQAGRVRMRVARAATSRTVLVRTVSARRGTNTVRFPRTLSPARYRITITTTPADGRPAVTKRTRLTVKGR